MSLINEALKKAQNMQARTPSGAASTTAPAPAPKLKTKAAQVVPPPFVPTVTTTATTSTPRRQVGGSKTVMAIGAALCIIAIAAIGFAMFAFFSKKQVDAGTGDSTPDEAAVATASTATEATTAAPPGSASTESASSTPATAAESPAAPAAGTTPAAAAPAPTEPAAPPPPPPKRINKPVARIQDFVNKITVSGTRSGENPRVLMNDRVYAIGDLVNAEMELHLTSITERELGFEDGEGNTYSLRF